MPASAILGAQWGDEGKGKIVDLFAPTADYVVRFQGGPNAGHTIVLTVNGQQQRVVLHHLPSGLLHNSAHNVMTQGMVVDPASLLVEIDEVVAAGFSVTPDRLAISLDAHLILPVHRALDAARESDVTQMLGTTKRGVGPAYEDRASRRGIRFRDLLDWDTLRRRVDALLIERNALLTAYGADCFQTADILNELESQRDRLAPFLTDTQRLLRQALNSGAKILFEGAQGALLDLAHGNFPFVTSSHTVTGGITVGTGMSPRDLGQVIGVAKAYVTRVGEGPFPTELTDDTGAKIAQRGHEFGSTTGRPRRCGWLDLVALRYAVDVCGLTSLVITKLDVLGGFPKVAVCTAYQRPGQSGPETIDYYPAGAADAAAVRPIYEWCDGWDDQIGSIHSDLPPTLLSYIKKIESYAGVPVSVLSMGPDRSESIVLGDPLWDSA